MVSKGSPLTVAKVEILFIKLACVLVSSFLRGAPPPPPSNSPLMLFARRAANVPGGPANKGTEAAGHSQQERPHAAQDRLREARCHG